jgi:putative hemolysin
LTAGDRLRLRKTHATAAKFIEEMLASPRSLLVAILLANVTANTLFFTLAGFVGADLPGMWGLAVGLASVLVMILCAEVLPKAIASAHRARIAVLLSGPLFAWYSLIGPVRKLMDRYVIGPLARLVRTGGSKRNDALTSDDLSNLIEVAATKGVLHEEEQDLLEDVLELSSLRVRDIMTPRRLVRWLDATGTSQELLATVRETGFTRFPVCRGQFIAGQVAGLVSARRVLPGLNKQGMSARLPLTQLIESAKYIPERARVDQLLSHFRSTNSDAALVVSEAGDITGFVQIDDVIDRFAALSMTRAASPQSTVRMVGLGEWEVPGILSVRDWEASFERDIRNPSQVGTVAGLMMAKLGRLAKVGDTVLLGGVAMKVHEMEGRSITKVRVTLQTQEKAGAP